MTIKEPDKDDKKKKLVNSVKGKAAKSKAIASYMGKMAVNPKNC